VTRPAPDPNDLIAGPRRRYGLEPTRRRRLAALTFALLVVVGVALMTVAWWVLALGLPASVTAVVVWVVPTLGTLTWVVARPGPAETHDANDDQTWPGYSIRYALVGEDTPRSLPLRVIAAILFGAPVGWCLVLVGGAIVLGFV
jgi:hypothetical protein